MGLLNGTFEALFEYVSLDKLLTSEPKNLIRALFRQGGVEASEEFMTTFANNIADILVMAEKSDYQLKIQAYMESGMSREEAAKQALLDKCIELGWDAVGGFFSGGISGSISTKVSGMNSSRGTQTQGQTQSQTQEPTQAQAQGMTAALQDQAPQLTAKTDFSAASPAVKPLNTEQQTEETEQYIAALRNTGESDTINEKDRRIALALELAAQGKTPSQIYQETGLVTKANGDIMDGFGGEVIWRNNGQEGISDRNTAGSKTEGTTQTEISGDDGRGDAGGLLSQSGRTPYASLTEQQRVRARDTIIRCLEETDSDEALDLLEEFGDDAELAQRIYSDYAAGDAALECWAEFFDDTEGLSRELDEILFPGAPEGSPLGGAVERSETEGSTTAAEATAKTDPAAAARQQQYQTEITAALRAGDYQLAMKRFKEFGNPNLRALNDFQTLKAFGDYAAAMGYGVSPEDISTDQTLAAFEESYRNAVEASNMDGTAFTPAQTLEEAQKYAKEVLGLKQTTAYSDGLNIDLANGLNEAIYKISKVFKDLTKAGYLNNILLSESKRGEYASYSLRRAAVIFNASLARLKNAVEQMTQDAIEEFENGSWSTGSPFHSLYHELGHAVQHMILDNDTIAQRRIDMPNWKRNREKKEITDAP